MNAKGYCGGSALYHAAREGHVEAAEFLLDRGADPDVANGAGITPLQVSLFHDDLALARMLLEHGARPTAHAWAALGETARLKQVHSAPPDPSKDTTGRGRHGAATSATPLHFAAAFDRVAAMDLLLANGAEVDPNDGVIGTPLAWAIWRGRQQAAEKLLAAGADPDARIMEVTMLGFAAWLGRGPLIAELLSHGADHDSQDRFGIVPLHYAAASGDRRTASALLRDGAPVEVGARVPEPVIVTWHRRAEAQQLGSAPGTTEAYRGVLVDPCGARFWQAILHDVRSSGRDPWVLQKWAQKEFGPEGFEALTMRWASIDAAGLPGFTPLHWAARRGHAEVASVLLEHDASMEGDYGVVGSPLHWAAFGDHADTARLLIDHDANVHAHAGLLGTPLHWAARGGGIQVADVLLAHGPDISARDDNSRTALHLAATYGEYGFVDWALAHGADPQATDSAGMPPRELTQEQGHDSVVDRLRAERQE